MKIVLSTINIDQLRAVISQLRFIEDQPGIEQLRSPWTVFELGGGDCDDVAILTAFWAKSKKFPFKFILWGDSEGIQHISTLVYVHGKQEHIDFYNNPDWKPLFYSQLER